MKTLTITLNSEDCSESGFVEMPDKETAESLVDNWDACITQAKRIHGDEWSVNDVIELMTGRGFNISVDNQSVPLFY